MPLCWIFLLKRRRALSNVSFSPTRTSANPGSPPQANHSPVEPVAHRRRSPRLPPRTGREPAEHSRGPRRGQTAETSAETAAARGPARQVVHARHPQGLGSRSRLRRRRLPGLSFIALGILLLLSAYLDQRLQPSGEPIRRT